MGKSPSCTWGSPPWDPVRHHPEAAPPWGGFQKHLSFADPRIRRVGTRKFWLHARGYVTYLESSLYGQVLTSQLLCPGCSPEDETHKMKLRLLHEFSLWGSGRSDYRELPTTLRYDRILKRYLMSRFNRTFHLVVHYPGKWGVNQVAIAACKNSEVEACLRNHHSSMVVTEVIRLENANSVKIQNAR